MKRRGPNSYASLREKTGRRPAVRKKIADRDARATGWRLKAAATKTGTSWRAPNEEDRLKPVLRQGGGGGGAIEGEPGFGGGEARVDVVDVLDAFGGEPIFECFDALLGVDGHAVFPSGATAKDA